MSKVKIGDIFDLEKGLLQSSKCTEGEFDFITAAEEWKTHNEFSHDMEALIFAAMASGSLGRTHYVNGKFITSDLCYIMTPKDSKKYPINLKFYHFVFNSLREDIVKNTKSGTSKEAINQTKLNSYEIPYFEIEQQNLWIEKLINTKAIKENLVFEIEKQQALLKKFRQSILQDAIEGKLTKKWREENLHVESASILLEKIKMEKEKLIKEKKIKKENSLPPIADNEIPFDIPQSWEWCRLGEIAYLKSGNTYSYKIAENGIPYVKVGDMNLEDNLETIVSSSTYFENTYIKESDLIPLNSIIFPKRGGAIATNKKRKILKKEILIDSNTMSITINKIIDFSYFYTWFTTVDLAKLGNDSVIPQVNNKDIEPIVLPLPPLEEQKEIVDTIEKLFALCDELESEINQNKTTVDNLMATVLKEAFEN